MSYNTAAIRKLLTAVFSDEELEIYCYDYFPAVYEKFASATGRLVKIQLLIDHCNRYNKFDELLSHIKDINADQYTKFMPPIKASPQPSQVDSSPKGQPAPRRILIVDDDKSWQRILQTAFLEFFQELSCTVELTSSYEEAKTYLMAPPDFDLATIDLNLDKSIEFAEGLELVSQIRQVYGPNFPIIIITGTGDLERQRRAFKDYDVIDFIEKAKFNYQELKEIVLKAIHPA